jgi:hypothetical protein
MTAFEFVSVLLSFVVSLALAHVLTGIARMVKASNLTPSLLLFGWIGIALFDCIDLWFSLWHARDATIWTVPYVLLWLAAAISIYLFAWLIVPDGAFDGRDLRADFENTRRKFVLGHAAYLVFGLSINMTLPQFQELVSLQVAIWFIPIALAWFWSNRWVQAASLLMTYGLMAYYIATYLPEL